MRTVLRSHTPLSLPEHALICTDIMSSETGKDQIVYLSEEDEAQIAESAGSDMDEAVRQAWRHHCKQVTSYVYIRL